MLVGFQQTQLSDGCKARCKIFHAFVVCWEEKGCLAGLGSLTLPPLPVAPDRLQRTLLVSRGPHLQGPGGDPAAARCAQLRRGRPSPPGSRIPALPDLVLGHEVHALGRGGAERFLRHAVEAAALGVSRRPGDGHPATRGAKASAL